MNTCQTSSDERSLKSTHSDLLLESYEYIREIGEGRTSKVFEVIDLTDGDKLPHR